MSNSIIPFYSAQSEYFKSSRGCYVYDCDDKEYLDLEAGVWCCNLGHSHPRVSARMAQLASEGIHHGYAFENRYARELSERFMEIASMEKGASVFLSSGSEAVNLAITLAINFTGKKKVMKISNSYLSAYGFGKIDERNQNLINLPYNKLEAISRIDFSGIAAFVFETGGASIDIVRFPDYEYVEMILAKCKENATLVIVDEVTTGMGRTGKWFGFKHYDIAPDIVVTGKGLGNGYPISAVTITEYWLEKFTREPFRYAQSHQNDPLGCAIALEVIDILKEENLILKSYQMGEYFLAELVKLKDDFPDKISEVRGRGLMLAMEFYPSLQSELIHNSLFEAGFITGYKNNALRMLPPLIIDQGEIDSFTTKLRELLQN